MKRVLAALSAVVVGVAGVAVATGQVSFASGPKSYTVANTPSTLVLGDNNVSITLNNTARNNIAFAAANLTVPAGLTVAPTSLSLGTTAGTASLVGTTIQLRNLNVVRGASVTVAFTLTGVATANPCVDYVFASDVRQSNNFNGTDNTFARTGADATFSGPCSSRTVTCTAGDTRTCSTGTIFSNGGNTASVTVNDADTISAVLEASVAPGALTCPEYTPTSDRLDFDIAVTAGSTVGVTKTVTFSQPVPAGSTKQAFEYEACFEAPYLFPALLPSQLTQDFANGDFSGNTTFSRTAVENGQTLTFVKGLLLPCSAGYGPPCINKNLTTISGGVVSITVTVPAADPGMRF